MTMDVSLVSLRRYSMESGIADWTMHRHSKMSTSELQDESGIDLTCAEDAAFWSPGGNPASPNIPNKTSIGLRGKVAKAKRRLTRLDKSPSSFQKKIPRTPLRRSERLRSKSKTETPPTDNNVKVVRQHIKIEKRRSMSMSMSYSSSDLADFPPLSATSEGPDKEQMIASPVLVSREVSPEDPEVPDLVSSSSSDEQMLALVPSCCPRPPQIASPDPDGMTCSQDGMTCSQDVMTCSQDVMTRPEDVMTHSEDVMTRSHDVMTRPKEIECESDLARMTLEYDHFGFLIYHQDIYLHRRTTELNYHPVESLANQPQVNAGMRAVLAEWLTRIHQKLDLKLDTLFISMNIVDRFLITTPIATNCIQLLGLTAILVAAKMNEVFPPLIPELLKTCKEKYSNQQMVQLERLVLVRLQFDLLCPSALFFAEYYAAERIRTHGFLRETTHTIMRARILARYLLELALQDYNLCQFQPSLLGLVALDQAEKFVSARPGMSRAAALTAYGHTQACVEECICDFQPIVQGLLANDPDIDFIVDKYSGAYGASLCPVTHRSGFV